MSLLYGIWSEITGPFCTYNYAKGDFEGRLAEKWKVENPTTWIFSLNKNYKFNDGSPVTADDVVHSIVNRVIKDPQSKQKASVAPSVVNAEAIDKFTVKITTDKPTAPLLSFFCDRLIITSKAMFDKYGRDVADKEHMIGAGPYRLKELIPGQRLVIAKNPNHPEAKRNPRAPDEVVYRIMREPEQRVTALLNDEIQIGQFVPPHMRQRVETNKSLRITPVDSVEIMFLAMQPKPPFDKKEVRQAVCQAINRDQIIATLLGEFRQPPRRSARAGTVRLRSDFEAKTQLRSGESQETLGAGRISQRRRCRTANPGGTLHSGQATHRSDDPDAQRRRHSRQAGDTRVGDALGQRAKRHGAFLLYGPRLGPGSRAPRCINISTPARRRASAIPIPRSTNFSTRSNRSSIRKNAGSICRKR